MNRIKLSIVVPVYNVEKYVTECLDSIIMQMIENCEIILVDDGSTDTSGIICDNYAKKYNFINVIHQENQGLAGARNSGLKVAKGDFVAFVDSDDKLSNGALAEVSTWMTNSPTDICFMKAIVFYPTGESKPLGDCIYSNELNGLSKAQAINYLSSRPKFPGSACTKIYRKSFLAENDLCFPSDGRLSEDLGFVRDCILKANDYSALDCSYYEYRQMREGSITNTKSVKSFNNLYLFVNESIDYLTQNRIPNDIMSENMMAFVAYEYSILLMLIWDLDRNNRKESFVILSKDSWVLKYAKTKYVKAIYIFSKVFGIRITSMLVKAYKELSKR